MIWQALSVHLLEGGCGYEQQDAHRRRGLWGKVTIEIIKELSENLRIIISYLNQVMQPLKTKQTYNTHEQQQKRCPTTHSTVEYSDSIVGPRREHGKSYIHIQDNGAHMWRGRNSTGSLDCYGEPTVARSEKRLYRLWPWTYVPLSSHMHSGMPWSRRESWPAQFLPTLSATICYPYGRYVHTLQRGPTG